MKYLFVLVTLFALSACSFEPPPWAATPVAADLILTNARVYSLAWPDPLPSGELSGSAPHEQGWQPDAQALAIKNGEIVFVGSHAQAARWRGDQTRAVDLKGATVIPGLVDSHSHVFQLGMQLNQAEHSDDRRRPGPTELTDNVLAGLQRMAADGYVAVHAAGLNAGEMEVLQRLEASGRLPIRVYAMLSLRDEELAREWLAQGPDTDADSMLVTRSVKARHDDALDSRGARLLEDYSDSPGHRGPQGRDYGFNEELAAEMMQAGFQLGIHAVGDAGNRESLRFLAGVMQRLPQTVKGRHRIEHAQVIQPADLTKFGELRVIASMQPVHAMEDKAWAEQRLGRHRMEGAYAWRTLRQKGAMLIFSSDNPGSDHSIFYGLHSAVTRKDKQGQPHFGWYPEQRLNMDEALRAYTRWPAFAGFRDQYTGVIKPGRWADLTVMDIDPFVVSETDPEAMLQGQILMTVVGGRIVYER